MPRLAVLDECKETECHPIFAVGGLVVDLDQVIAAEQAWRGAKEAAGLEPEEPVKFHDAPPDTSRELFEAIGRMPIRGLAVLLEDFRPRQMRLPGFTTRRDIHVYRQAFEYALQRLSRDLTKGSPGPHFIAFDRRDDFAELEEVYSRCHRGDWPIGKEQGWPALKDVGFVAGLMQLAHGPLHEVADFVVGGLTVFAGCAAPTSGGGVSGPRSERSTRAAGPSSRFSLVDPATGRGWDGAWWCMHASSPARRCSGGTSSGGWMSSRALPLRGVPEDRYDCVGRWERCSREDPSW